MMINIIDFLDFFGIVENAELLGVWYPRVVAVMSCVVPTAYIIITLCIIYFILKSIWGMLANVR